MHSSGNGTNGVGFRLPPDVTCEPKQFSHGTGYEFRHARLGQLGRLVLSEVNGQCQISSEVAGDPDDPMTQKRGDILEPITRELTGILTERLGAAGPMNEHAPPVPAPPDGGEYVRSELILCERCGEGAAIIVHADDAVDEAGIEDYARKIYRHIVEKNLPTWVIGPQHGDGDPEQLTADALHVWPEREPLQKLTPPEVRATVDAAIARHCRCRGHERRR